MVTPDVRTGDFASVRFLLRKPAYVELVFALVFVWGFGDALSTILALALTGTHAMEINPWIRVLLAHDPLWMVALKGAVSLYVGVVLLECRAVVERVPGWRAWFLTVLVSGTLVICGNVYVGLTAAL